MRKFKLIIASLLLGASAAHAQLNMDLSTATGASKEGSSYSAMFRQYAEACPKLGLRERETSGSGENLELLTTNKVKMAWVQSDVLHYTNMLDPSKVRNVRALFPLFKEELHFISPAKQKTVGKFAALGIGEKVELTKLSDLRGKKLGASGGAVTSATIVNAKTGLAMKIVTYPSNQALLNALVKGDVDAGLIVGGAPHAAVKVLNTSYRIMEVDQEFMKPLGDVYSPAKLTYNNMAQVGVQSISTPALVVTRVYSKKVSEKLQEAQQCMHAMYEDIKDSDNSHEKWQQVDLKADMKWPAYDFSK